MRSRNLRWILLAVVAAAYVIGGLSRISFDVDILKLLPTHLPQVHGLSLFLEHFAQPNELILTLEGDDPDALAEAADSLAADLNSHPELVARAVSKPPWESSPQQLAELLAYLLINQPPDRFRDILDQLSPQQSRDTLDQSLAELSESFDPAAIALRSYDPFRLTAALDQSTLPTGASEFASEDGTFRVVYVESAKPFANYVETREWIEAINRIVDAWKGGRAITIGYTGEPGFVADISGNMQSDMSTSGGMTLLIIAAMFWFSYRRLQPLLLLQAMLLLIFLLSLATAGWFFDDLTVIGVGFAAVMIGLSVDYGFFVFQTSIHHTGDARSLRKDCFVSIVWTCTTTAAAFFALNFSSLPGLSQLGNLVGLGVVIGAGVMLGIFTSIAVRYQQRHPIHPPVPLEKLIGSRTFLRTGAIATALFVLFLLGVLIVKGPPEVDFSERTLRPRVSEAYAAMDKLYANLSDDRGLLSLVVEGDTITQTRERLIAAERDLQAARDLGDLSAFYTALPLWPDESNQSQNLATAAAVASELPRLREEMLAAGFTENAFALTEGVVEQWRKWSHATEAIWPENDASRWILRRLVNRDDGRFLASGIAYPAEGRSENLPDVLDVDGAYLVSWEQLSRQLQTVVPGEMARVILALAALVIGILVFGLRSPLALVLFVVTTALVLLSLFGAMSLLGIPFSFFNLAAILLLLGTGTDYSILLLLALRRSGGDAFAAQRRLGIIIALCSLSAVAGFGSIVRANHIGLSQLGITCAIGLLIDAALSLFLLPVAWEFLSSRRTHQAAAR